jgi:bacterioferritin
MKNVQLINLLNRQFNREVSALLRYLTEAASLNGAEQVAARKIYLKEVGKKVEQAQYLADQIVALGGRPTLKLDFGLPQGTAREMLRRDVGEEQSDEKNYLRLASAADRARLAALKLRMQEQAAVEHEHVSTMESLLW